MFVAAKAALCCAFVYDFPARVAAFALLGKVLLSIHHSALILFFRDVVLDLLAVFAIGEHGKASRYANRDNREMAIHFCRYGYGGFDARHCVGNKPPRLTQIRLAMVNDWLSNALSKHVHSVDAQTDCKLGRQFPCQIAGKADESGFL